MTTRFYFLSFWPLWFFPLCWLWSYLTGREHFELLVTYILMRCPSGLSSGSTVVQFLYVLPLRSINNRYNVCLYAYAAQFFLLLASDAISNSLGYLMISVNFDYCYLCNISNTVSLADTWKIYSYCNVYPDRKTQPIGFKIYFRVLILVFKCLRGLALCMTINMSDLEHIWKQPADCQSAFGLEIRCSS